MLRLRLLGAVELAHDGQLELHRLPSRPATLLLARLALFAQRQHPREELIELLWPGVALDAGRNRLRQTLSTLRSLLESPRQPLFQADRHQLSLLPGAVEVDVTEFEAALARGDAEQARALYGGELLPGYFDDWVLAERHRLTALFERLPADPPTIRSGSVATPPAPARATSSRLALPRYLTRYFPVPGRAEQLLAQVTEARLQTLTGPGGVGKTRLAVEFAGQQQRAAGWACAFVDLAEARSLSDVLTTLEQALSPTHSGGWPAIEAAVRGLHLLILDNAEQALPAVTELCRRCLDELPELRLIVTSRHPLGLDGEALLELAPLPPDGPVGEALFIDRARAVRADFHASRDNRAALTALVAALDGLPLALELAAARVRSFSPAQMLAQLQAAQGRAGPLPSWLANPSRGPRHGSIDALLRWSLALLDAPARELLTQLAALPGAFSLADVIDLAGDAQALDELVSHSLVQAGPGDEPRYRLLDLLRQGVLVGADPALPARARSRLRAALTGWANGLNHRAPLGDWAPRRALARALVGSAAQDGDASGGLQLALALRPCWESDGVDRLLVEQLGGLLRDPALVKAADGHELRAHLAFTQGDRALALAEAERAVALAATPASRAAALVRRAWVLLAGDRSDQGQRDALDEAIALARRAGDVAAEARGWHQLGALSAVQAQPAQAEVFFAISQQLWEQLGHRRQAQARLRNRAQSRIELGEVALGMAWIRATQAQAEADQDWVGQLDAAYSLATAHQRLRDWPAMLAATQQALAIAHDRQHLHGLALSLQLLGRPLAHLRQPEVALQLAAFACAFWQRHLGQLNARDLRLQARVRRLCRAQIGPARAQAAWATGELLDRTAAIALAMQPAGSG